MLRKTNRALVETRKSPILRAPVIWQERPLHVFGRARRACRKTLAVEVQAVQEMTVSMLHTAFITRFPFLPASATNVGKKRRGL